MNFIKKVENENLCPMNNCEWFQSLSETIKYDIWHTSCGNDVILNDEKPYNNDFKFCPYCGKEIIEVIDK